MALFRVVAAFALGASVVTLVEGGAVDASASRAKFLRTLRRGSSKGMNPGWSPVALPVLSKSLATLAHSCKCMFREECNCKASMEFMDCIADACVSGDCQCSEPMFTHACQDMSLTCPTVGIQCSQEEATCLHDDEIHDDAETVEDLLIDLEVLRARRCRLRIAAKDGWLNADNRLNEVEVKIEKKMKYLKYKGAEASPYMGCKKTGGVVPVKKDKDTAKMKPARERTEAKEDPVEMPRQPGAYEGAVIGGVIWAIPMFIIACIYNRHREKAKFPQMSPENSYWNTGSQNMKDDNFKYPLFGCFEDMSICCMAIWCFPVRWADTVAKFKLKLCGMHLEGSDKEPSKGFWTAFLIWMIVAIIDPVIWGVGTIILLIMQIAMRQQMRHILADQAGKKVGQGSIFQDCFVWTCCAPCALVQESREVEVWRETPY